MLRRPRQAPPPSYRNLEVYHELVREHRTQLAVAAMFGLSQCRVSQIGRRVAAWVDRILPRRFFKGDPGLRLHLAIARERVRLQDAYDPLIDMFIGPDGSPRYIRRYLAVVDGEPLHTVEISEQPDFRLLNQAEKALGRLAELEAIANRGPFADAPGRVRQTIVHRFVGSSCREEPAATSDGNAPVHAAPVKSDSGNSRPVRHPGPACQIASTPTKAATTHPLTAHKSATMHTENQGRGVLEAPLRPAALGNAPCCPAVLCGETSPPEPALKSDLQKQL